MRDLFIRTNPHRFNYTKHSDIPFLIQDEVCDVAGKPITSLTLDDINDFLNGREHHFDSNKTSSSYSKRSN
jgi:hypothetical protein